MCQEHGEPNRELDNLDEKWREGGGAKAMKTLLKILTLIPINILSEKTYIVYNWSFISPPDKLKVTYMSDAD